MEQMDSPMPVAFKGADDRQGAGQRVVDHGFQPGIFSELQRMSLVGTERAKWHLRLVSAVSD